MKADHCLEAVSRCLAEVAGNWVVRKPFGRTATDRTVTGHRNRQVGRRRWVVAAAVAQSSVVQTSFVVAFSCACMPHKLKR